MKHKKILEYLAFLHVAARVNEMCQQIPPQQIVSVIESMIRANYNSLEREYDTVCEMKGI